MARLLLRAAPGVRATSSRLTTVVGVAVSVGTSSVAPETVTVSFAPATLSAKCSTGFEPETTMTSCWACSNPTPATVTVYSPSGTALNTKLPPATELTVDAQSEYLALIMTMASSTGRCCGSWNTPGTDPTTAA